MTTPAVSIVLPVRDGAAFLAEALDSLSRQTFSDFEIVAIDDGSSDDTPTILRRHVAADPRLRIVRTTGVGIAAALNLGIEEARAPLLARMDADDRSRPDRLAAQVAFLARHPRVGVVGTQMQPVTDAAGAMAPTRLPCDPDSVRRVMQDTCCLAHPTVMMRRAIVVAAGSYRTEFRHAEDYDLWLRLLDRADLANLPDIGLDYRVHPSMSTVRSAEAQEIEAMVARHLARLRQAGEAEPDLGPAPIGRETLARLGFDERTIARHVRKTWFKAARSMHKAGDAAGRRQCIEAAGPMRLPRGGLLDVVDYILRSTKVHL